MPIRDIERSSSFAADWTYLSRSHARFSMMPVDVVEAWTETSQGDAGTRSHPWCSMRVSRIVSRDAFGRRDLDLFSPGGCLAEG